MSAWPGDLVDYLLELAQRERHVAFVSLDPEGRVASVGGALERFGLGALPLGADARDQLPWLVGSWPTPGETVVLPTLQLSPQRAADVHLTRRGDQVHVILLDSTAGTERVAAVQQHSYDLALRMAALERTHQPSASLLREVLHTMGAVVYARLPDGTLQRPDRAPHWATALGDRLPTRLATSAWRSPEAEMASFLFHFLEEAEDFWGRRKAGMHRSGPWVESLSDGTEMDLEATALCLPGGQAALLVQHLGERFEERRGLLQAARTTSLEFEALRREIQKKEILLHCIVHDLNAPLSVIVGSLSMLRRPQASMERQQELVDMGLKQTRRQVEMIRLVLDVFASEIDEMESFETDPSRAPDVARCIRELTASLAPAFQQGGARLLCGPGVGDQRVPVVGEASRLERVLTNLVDNARRHGPAGTQVVIDLQQDDTHVTVSVEDEGPGVPPELADSLFDKFRRGNAGGMAGLGLYFCRHTVERWGGTIGHQPREPNGSRFWFRLPRPEAALDA